MTDLKRSLSSMGLPDQKKIRHTDRQLDKIWLALEKNTKKRDSGDLPIVAEAIKTWIIEHQDEIAQRLCESPKAPVKMNLPNIFSYLTDPNDEQRVDSTFLTAVSREVNRTLDNIHICVCAVASLYKPQIFVTFRQGNFHY